MGMLKKIDYLRRAPGIGDYNLLVDTVNEIIDKLNAKIEIEEVSISRKVKDFKFFNGEEQSLPYHAQHTLSSVEDASKVFEHYVFSFKEMKGINDLIINGKVVSLTVDVEEEITEKDIEQEAIFEIVESEPVVQKKKTTKKTKKSKKKNSRA